MLRILITLCETHLGSYIGLSLAMILYRMLLNLFVIWGKKTIGLGVAQIYKMRTYKVTADCFLNLKDFFRLLLGHVQFRSVAEGGEGEVPVDSSSPSPPPLVFFQINCIHVQILWLSLRRRTSLKNAHEPFPVLDSHLTVPRLIGWVS